MHTPTAPVSVIVPVLDELPMVAALDRQLRALADHGCETIVVDGGSSDGSFERLAAPGRCVLRSAPGRARQMNAGAQLASRDVLLFLHADTRIEASAIDALCAALARSRGRWGRFDVRIAGCSRWLPLVAALMNLRSRLSGIATGDQAIFVRRDAFTSIGGFADQPLLEDVELCRRLRRGYGRPLCLAARVVTSGRRWDTRGAWPTIVLMWRLRWDYWRGVAPERLAERYR